MIWLVIDYYTSFYKRKLTVKQRTSFKKLYTNIEIILQEQSQHSKIFPKIILKHKKRIAMLFFFV